MRNLLRRCIWVVWRVQIGGEGHLEDGKDGEKRRNEGRKKEGKKRKEDIGRLGDIKGAMKLRQTKQNKMKANKANKRKTNEENLKPKR